VQVKLTIVYGQICVFNSDLEAPYNDWSERSVAQGFAYREGAVAFRVPDHTDAYAVCVTYRSDGTHKSESPKREWRVPFDVGSECEFGSVFETFKLDLDLGHYALTVGIYEGCDEIHINFQKSQTPVLPQITAGQKLPNGQGFFMDEDPA